MRNGKRLDTAEADHTSLSDGDEIAVFPPVAGG
jgi:molybdopterin synthase sulfur carrier subunit